MTGPQWHKARHDRAYRGRTESVGLLPSEWMWNAPSDLRLHACYAAWLAKNATSRDNPAAWTAYRCACYGASR